VLLLIFLRFDLHFPILISDTRCTHLVTNEGVIGITSTVVGYSGAFLLHARALDDDFFHLNLLLDYHLIICYGILVVFTLILLTFGPFYGILIRCDDSVLLFRHFMWNVISNWICHFHRQCNLYDDLSDIWCRPAWLLVVIVWLCVLAHIHWKTMKLNQTILSAELSPMNSSTFAWRCLLYRR